MEFDWEASFPTGGSKWSTYISKILNEHDPTRLWEGRQGVGLYLEAVTAERGVRVGNETIAPTFPEREVILRVSKELVEMKNQEWTRFYDPFKMTKEMADIVVTFYSMNNVIEFYAAIQAAWARVNPRGQERVTYSRVVATLNSTYDRLWGTIEEKMTRLMMGTQIGNSCSNCGKCPVKRRCKRCKQVRYCGKECQVTHWHGVHSKICKSHKSLIFDCPRD